MMYEKANFERAKLLEDIISARYHLYYTIKENEDKYAVKAAKKRLENAQNAMVAYEKDMHKIRKWCYWFSELGYY